MEGYPHFKTFVSAKAEMDQISRWLAQSVKLPKLLLPDGFDTISILKGSLQAIKTKPLSSITSDWTAETTSLI